MDNVSGRIEVGGQSRVVRERVEEGGKEGERRDIKKEGRRKKRVWMEKGRKGKGKSWGGY